MSDDGRFNGSSMKSRGKEEKKNRVCDQADKWLVSTKSLPPRGSSLVCASMAPKRRAARLVSTCASLPYSAPEMAWVERQSYWRTSWTLPRLGTPAQLGGRKLTSLGEWPT